MKKIYLTASIVIIAIVALASAAYVLMDQDVAPNLSPVAEDGKAEPVQDELAKTEGLNKDADSQENATAETPDTSGLHVCDRSPEPNLPGMLCYTAKQGDTLWGIAERYLGTGFRWNELHDGPPHNGEYEWDPETLESVYVGYSRLKDPATQLWPGMEVGMHTSSMLPLDLEGGAGGYFVETSKLSPYGDNLLIVVNTRGSNQKLVYLNGERYNDRTYRAVSHINFSDHGRRITYIGKNSADACELLNNRVAFEFTCGNDIQDPVFSPNGEHFSLRTNLHHPNLWQVPDKFYVVSNIGNGPYYDYVDSLMWVDDETLVYRAQTDEEWRVVVNHEDLAKYNYLDNLTVNNGVISFDARHEVWAQETIDLSGK